MSSYQVLLQNKSPHFRGLQTCIGCGLVEALSFHPGVQGERVLQPRPPLVGFCLCRVPLLHSSHKQNHTECGLCDWPLSLRMSSRFIPFHGGYYPVVWTHSDLSIHLVVDLGGSILGNTVNSSRPSVSVSTVGTHSRSWMESRKTDSRTF